MLRSFSGSEAKEGEQVEREGWQSGISGENGCQGEGAAAAVTIVSKPFGP